MAMPADLAPILADLSAETSAVDELLSRLEPDRWELPSPAPGWSIRDQISHLAYFDQAAVQAATDPEVFRTEADALMAQGDRFADDVAVRFRDLDVTELRNWFHSARSRLLHTFATLDKLGIVASSASLGRGRERPPTGEAVFLSVA
jgi:uncharacterized protein (TIGR03083 family)